MAWVCVSENFDVAKLTNEIIESITGQACNLKQLNSLQDALKQKVNGKRVFIVLDDVWNERQEPWDSFRAPFIGAETVKILVTTRNDSVARIIQTVPPFRPGFLDHDQCWSLFKHHAFGGQNLDEYPRLVKIGCRIIEKCGYLPLSVKSIGSLLRYEFDEERWMEILESDLWDLDLARKCILPALMLSYHHLPSHLKPCFLYSSMFPKDYRFERDRLVKLWIAQGFIVPRVNRSLEDIGNNYFDELLGRSFFQLSYGSACNLHDAIHDLARSIAGGEYYAVRLEGESLPLNISKEVRHLYVEFVDGKATVELLSFKAPSSVRTLIVEPPFFWDPDDVNYNFGNLDHLGGLRVIEMQHKYFCSSATNLKHLRYLSVCGFERDERFKFDIALPESSVHHLQTLPTLDTTFSCRPQSIIYHLSNLFHLRFLKLSLSDHGGFVGCINVADEKMSKFLCKRRCFCPPVSFTEIVITGICYLPCNPSLSNWEEGRFTDAAFPRLAKITFMYTAELRSIAVLPFSSLKCLKIRSCNKLTSLPCLQVLAHLQELHLQHCVQLQLRQQESLPPSLRRVHISDCPSLRMVAGLQKLTSLRSLELRGCPNLRFLSHDGLPLKPQNVVIVDCPKLREWCKKIEFEYIQDEVIKELTLHDYSEFNGIPGSWISIDDSSLSSDEWLPSTLQTLEVLLRLKRRERQIVHGEREKQGGGRRGVGCATNLQRRLSPHVLLLFWNNKRVFGFKLLFYLLELWLQIRVE